MIEAPIPSNESDRMKRVRAMGVLDNLEPDPRFDELTKMATERFDVPISTLTILDEKKEHYKSCYGLDVKEGERAISFCGHALLAKDISIIPDCTKDERFKDNPMVVGAPFIRFYAGIALYDYSTRFPIAVFCIKDTKARQLSVKETGLFLSIATRAEEILNGVSKENLTPIL